MIKVYANARCPGRTRVSIIAHTDPYACTPSDVPGGGGLRVYFSILPSDNRQTRGRCSIVAHRRMPNRPYVHCGIAGRPAFANRESTGASASLPRPSSSSSSSRQMANPEARNALISSSIPSTTEFARAWLSERASERTSWVAADCG